MFHLKTSSEAKEILERFRRATGVRPNLWARAALGYSLSLQDPLSGDYDSGGSEFLEKVLLGEDAPVFYALLRQSQGRSLSTEEIQPLIKSHLERGLRHFYREYQRNNNRGDELMLGLLEQCSSIAVVAETTSNGRAPHGQFKVTLELATSLRDNSPLIHSLAAPGHTPHIAIMGRNGTGKTRTGLTLLTQIGKFSIPIIVFDYAKGDIAANRTFCESIDAEVINPPVSRIPLAPLSLVSSDTHAAKLASHRFRDSINAVVRLGPKQQNRCLEILNESYEMTMGGTPDLDDLVRIAARLYEENDWPEDSLLAILREFTAFPLFRSSFEGIQHRFFQRSHVIDLHALPESLRKLAAFLILDRLYAEIMTLPDAPLDEDGNRQLRLIIVIDEAHHYLPCKQPTLERIVREVRSKGVAMWLLSQSPDDFDQQRYNFAREMGLAVVFSCVLEKPRMLEALLGASIDPKKLSQLNAGVGLTRLPGSDSVIEAQFWK